MIIYRYAVTKLVEMFAAIRLTEILDVSRTGVVVNYVCPGVVKSKLTREMKWKAWFQYAVFQFLVGRSTEMASRVYLHALAAGKESHGRYVSHAKDTK
jgi:NAD(P)-dependent dehydrogenase (short-subunit alcohol dehydrogenase family)